MKNTERLRVFLYNRIEHNVDHANRFRGWVEWASDAAIDILTVAEIMAQANIPLQAVLDKLRVLFPIATFKKEFKTSEQVQAWKTSETISVPRRWSGQKALSSRALYSTLLWKSKK